MSINTKLNLLDRFNDINILIKELEEDSNNNNYIPKLITIGNLAEKFGYTQLEWSYILNEYTLQTKNIYDKLVIFFLIEINEKENLTKIILLPSFYDKLDKILKKNNIVNCSVYAFTLYNNNFKTHDYGAIFNEIPIVQKYKIENENKINKKEKIEKKINVYDDKAEENYYGDFVPKVQNKEKKTKRKNKKSPDKNLTKSSKNGYTVIDDDNQNNNENIIKEEKEKYKIINEEKEIDIIENPKERKKVIKTRKVKKTNTFMDENGYMVTKDQWTDEEYETYEEENEKKHNIHHPVQPIQPQKKNKKVQKGQTNLFSFFSK